MFLKNLRSKQLKKSPTELLKTYESIHDLPQIKWNEIHVNQTYQPLVISGEATDRELESVWEKIFDQYIDEIGFSDNYKEVLEKQREILINKCDLGLTEDKALKTIIQINEIELNELLSGGKGMNFNESILHISKYAGYGINSQKITVAEYNGWIKLMSQSANNGN